MDVACQDKSATSLVKSTFVHSIGKAVKQPLTAGDGEIDRIIEAATIVR